MDNRRPIFASQAERAVDEALQEAATRCGARIYPKVRLADVLRLTRGALTPSEYDYALRAHCDFAVGRHDDPIAFIVEFDGAHHRTDPGTRRRDLLKNSICEKLGMPLLRIDATYLRRIGRFSIVGWLAEVWFLQADFDAAQDRGDIPPDEPFDFSGFIGLAYRRGEDLVEIDASEPAAALTTIWAHKGQLVPTQPYNPFGRARAAIIKAFEHRDCLEGCPRVFVERKANDDIVGAALLDVRTGTLVGKARCRGSSFGRGLLWELAEELAVVDVHEKLLSYLAGTGRPANRAVVDYWRRKLATREVRRRGSDGSSA